MSEKRRPASLHRGPLPEREPIPSPGDRRVVFHFDTGGDVGVTLPESEIEPLRESVGEAWNSPQGQMFTISDEDGRPFLLVHLGKVRAVQLR